MSSQLSISVNGSDGVGVTPPLSLDVGTETDSGNDEASSPESNDDTRKGWYLMDLPEIYRRASRVDPKSSIPVLEAAEDLRRQRRQTDFTDEASRDRLCDSARHLIQKIDEESRPTGWGDFTDEPAYNSNARAWADLGVNVEVYQHPAGCSATMRELVEATHHLTKAGLLESTNTKDLISDLGREVTDIYADAHLSDGVSKKQLGSVLGKLDSFASHISLQPCKPSHDDHVNAFLDHIKSARLLMKDHISVATPPIIQTVHCESCTCVGAAQESDSESDDQSTSSGYQSTSSGCT